MVKTYHDSIKQRRKILKISTVFSDLNMLNSNVIPGIFFGLLFKSQHVKCLKERKRIFRGLIF